MNDQASGIGLSLDQFRESDALRVEYSVCRGSDSDGSNVQSSSERYGCEECNCKNPAQASLLPESG
jgi:hypothetical protein